MFKIENFTKKYASNNYISVDNLTIEAKEGEILGFLGPNGAGKSTTIKSLVGILPFDKGTITICGHDILKEGQEAKKCIGYVSDNHAVYERLTGREYVNHIANLYDVPLEERKKTITEYLKLLDLEKAYDKPIKSYSHGMKQKISVIAALVHNPKLWVLDEPLTGLDPQSAYQLKKVMKAHAKKGNTVFFSSHILDVVEKLCDRACIIKKGKLIGIYDLHKLKKEGQSLEELFMSVVFDNEEEKEEAIKQ